MFDMVFITCDWSRRVKVKVHIMIILVCLLIDIALLQLTTVLQGVGVQGIANTLLIESK
jgi:hypothetical protein